MEFDLDVFECFNKQAVVAVGNEEDHNAMVIGWGGLGTMWNKPSCTIYVRPSRYTHDYLEDAEYFTVSFYDDSYKKNLVVYGTKSGRDVNKEEVSGFHVVPVNNSVTFKEAKLTLVCKKLYVQRMETELMPKEVQERFYKDGDVHDMYIAEVLEVIK